jgi:hypothetical protein
MLPRHSDPRSRADLESLLRTRQLDRTLTSSLPPLDPHDEYAIGSSGVPALDQILGGGFPRGQISEIVGSRSSGRTSLITRLMAAATARHELVALVDVLDMFDVESAERAGVDLTQLLWVRGQVAAHPGLARDRNHRPMEQAIRALALVVGAGNFGLVVFDAGEAPADALQRLPFTTWLRLQRMVEGRQTICVLVAGESIARSSSGLTVKIGQVSQVGQVGERPRPVKESWQERRGGQDRRGGQERMPTEVGSGFSRIQRDGIRFDHQLFDGFDLQARVIRARARASEDVCVSLSTTCA